jgi:hypothetical protein
MALLPGDSEKVTIVSACADRPAKAQPATAAASTQRLKPVMMHPNFLRRRFFSPPNDRGDPNVRTARPELPTRPSASA